MGNKCNGKGKTNLMNSNNFISEYWKYFQEIKQHEYYSILKVQEREHIFWNNNDSYEEYIDNENRHSKCRDKVG